MAHLSIYLLKTMIFHRKFLNYQRVGNWLFVIGKVQPSGWSKAASSNILDPKKLAVLRLKPTIVRENVQHLKLFLMFLLFQLIKPSSPHHAIVGRLKSIDMLILYSDATTHRHRCWWNVVSTGTAVNTCPSLAGWQKSCTMLDGWKPHE